MSRRTGKNQNCSIEELATGLVETDVTSDNFVQVQNAVSQIIIHESELRRLRQTVQLRINKYIIKKTSLIHETNKEK
jgi:hypothetical protein